MGELSPALGGALLLTIRWFVALRLQPHWSLALGRLWWPVAAGLAIGVAAATDVPGAPLRGLQAWALAVTLEIGLGAVLGILASLPAYALLGGASASASALRTVPMPLVRMSVSAALVAALSLRMHHPALVALHDQALGLPPGRLSNWIAPDLLGTFAALLDGMLILALTLATPVLLTVVVVRSVCAVLGAGPAVSRPFSDAVGPALATAAALLAFAASWSVYPAGWARGAIAVGGG